jgi:predicted  nucleic acid-binding Zn-ribbon protein
MKDLHGDAAARGGEREDMGLNALELLALEQYYLGEEDRRTRELNALEDRLTRRMEALDALEAKLTQGLNAVQEMEARLKKELNALEAGRREAEK